MNNNLYLFAPKDKPFGALSINANIPIIIDRQKWSTITHYIYGSLLNDPTYVNQVRLQKSPKEAVALYNELYTKQGDTNVLNAIKEGTLARFSTLPDLKLKLLDTGESKLYYVDNSSKLGIGRNSTGANYIGRGLELARSQLKVGPAQREEEKRLKVYNIYLANEILSRYLLEGKDISEFENSNYLDIINSYGYSKISSLVPTRDIILNQYTRGRLDPVILTEVENPGNLVGLIKRFNLPKIRRTNLDYASRVVFDRYTTDILKKNFPNISEQDISFAKTQQLTKLNPSALTSLISRVNGLYDNNKLSSEISEEIQNIISTIYIPSEEEITKAESYEVKEKVESEPERVIRGDIYFKADPEEDETYGFLSPFSDEGGPFAVGEFRYPTLMHYIFVSALSSLKESVGGIRQAHELIMTEDGNFNMDLESIRNLYLDYEKQNKAAIMIKAMKKGNDVKFEARELQNLLLSTGDLHLIYSDFSNPILGYNRKTGGQNEVGKYLEVIRERLREERGDDALKFVYIVTASEDPEIEKWYLAKTNDALTTAIILKDYVDRNSGRRIETLGEVLINDAIDNLSNITIPSSYEEPEMIEGYPDFVRSYLEDKSEKITDNGILAIWRYLSYTADIYNVPISDRDWLSKKTVEILNASLNLKKERALPDVINDSLIKFVVNEMYLPCSNLEEGYTIGAISSKYNDFVRNSVAKLGQNITDRAVFELWKYVSLLSREMISQMDKDSKSFSDEISKILDTVYQGDVKCKKIFPSRSKNCIFTALYNIIGRIDTYGRIYGVQLKLDERVVYDAVNILMGTSEEEITKLKDDPVNYAVSENISNKLGELSTDRRSLKRIIPKIVAAVEMIYALASENQNVRSRILFFAEIK